MKTLREKCAARGIDYHLYRVWSNLRHRCSCESAHNYKYWGGRGVTVCKQWDNFEAFAADVGPHPGRGWSLDRKNNNSGYRLSNVRWASPKTQQRNTRMCKLTESKANRIRADYARGYRRGRKKQAPPYRLEDVAIRFGVSKALVSMVVRNERWA